VDAAALADRTPCLVGGHVAFGYDNSLQQSAVFAVEAGIAEANAVVANTVAGAVLGAFLFGAIVATPARVATTECAFRRSTSDEGVRL